MQFGNNFFGMNIEEVKGVAGSLDTQAKKINEILEKLTRTLSSTPWSGPDRDRFVEEWSNIHVKAIKKAAEDVQKTVTKVRADISLQEHTSQN